MAQPAPITVFTTLVGDGKIGRFYAGIKRKMEIREILPPRYATVELFPKKAKRGTTMALAWLHDALRNGVLSPGDLLVTDNEGSFLTNEFEETLDENDILHLTYPAYLGCKLDPCDNAFHATVRLVYAERRIGKSASSVEDQLRDLFYSYKSMKEAAVRGYFRHCGLLGGDARERMAQLLLEGNMYKRKWRALHAAQLAAYVEFRKTNGWLEPEERRAKRGAAGPAADAPAPKHRSVCIPE